VLFGGLGRDWFFADLVRAQKDILVNWLSQYLVVEL
jgi:hypothetical protein